LLGSPDRGDARDHWTNPAGANELAPPRRSDKVFMMQNRMPSLPLTFAALVSLPLLAACGSSSTGTGTGPAPDAGNANPDGAVMPQPDAAIIVPGTDGGSAKGTQLAMGADFVDGVTDDGHVLYDDNTNLYAVPIAGGTPAMITAFSPSTGDRAGSIGNVGIIYTKVNNTTGIGTLSVWTAAGGLKQLSTTSVPGRGTAAVSKDGMHVAYFDGASTTMPVANLTTAAPDGTGVKQLVAGVQFVQACIPQIAYGGTSLVASYCTSVVPDASTPQANVAAFAAGSTTPIPLASGALGFAPDPTGARVLVSATNGMTVYPIGGGAGTLIDATGTFGGFTKDGMTVIYTTTANALKRSAVTSPSPLTLLTTGANGLDAVSPDESWAIVSQGQDMTTGNLDLYIASAKTAGTATGLVTTTTANILGDAFTADSSHALYYTTLTTSMTSGNTWGTLNAAPTAGGAALPLATGVAVNLSLSGSKEIIAANFADNMTGGTADIAVIDATSAGAPSVVASKADAFFLLTSDLSKVVYSTSTQSGASQGIWVAPAQ
jgi:hypothetical protein